MIDKRIERMEEWKRFAYKAVRNALDMLYDAGKRLSSQTLTPYVPIPKPPSTIKLSSEFSWPAVDENGYITPEKIADEKCSYDISRNDHNIAIRILRCYDYRPSAVAEVVRNLEQARQWCLETMEWRLNEAMRILDEERDAVGFIEAQVAMSSLQERT